MRSEETEREHRRDAGAYKIKGTEVFYASSIRASSMSRIGMSSRTG
jgi:hypothetical protein